MERFFQYVCGDGKQEGEDNEKRETRLRQSLADRYRKSAEDDRGDDKHGKARGWRECGEDGGRCDHKERAKI